jgi:hypothetical protein
MDLKILHDLKKPYIVAFFVFFNAILTLLLYDRYKDTIKTYYLEYIKIKEMKFLLNNRIQTTLKPDEVSLSQFFKSKNYEVESVYTGENGIEVKLKHVNPYNLVETIYDLESNGITVVKLKAVDNTGLGKMSVFMVLK